MDPQTKKTCDQNCPAENVNDKYSIECRQCKHLFHLPCYDIVHPREKLFVSKNVVFICDGCLESIDSGKSPKRKIPSALNDTPKSVRQTKLVSDASGKISMSASNVSDDKSRNSKLSNEVKVMISNLAKKLDENTKQLSENTGVVSKLKKSVESVHDTVLNGNKTSESQNRSGVPSQKTFAKILQQNQQTPNATQTQRNITPKSTIRPKLNSDRDAGREKANELIVKMAMKKRTLKVGTSSSVQHSLGKVVAVQNQRPKKIWKSLYITRVSTDVNCDQIVNYIKGKIPDVNQDDIKVHMLVKRDQPLEKLTFISFRVACIDTLYGKLDDASFWPPHVMIGDFVERPRKPKMGDFINYPPLNKQSIPVNEIDSDIENIENSSTPSMFPNGSSHPFHRAENSTTNNINNSEKTENDTTTGNDDSGTPANMSVEFLDGENDSNKSKNE